MKSTLKTISNPRYFAPLFVFASLNIITGTWVLYIPFIKEKLSLNDAEIGIALFSFAIGALITIPFSPKIIQYFGTGKATGIGIMLFVLFYLFPILSDSHNQLCFSLFTIGLFSSVTNIAMNALVAEIEKKDSINFMSTAHGFFSLGGVIGAGIGSFLAPLFTKPLYHFSLIITLLIIINIFLFRNYYTITSFTQKKNKKVSLKKLNTLFLLAFVGIIISGNEGSIEHWSSLFLKDEVHIKEEKLMGFGFLFFSFFMMIGRFFGDTISNKIGSIKIIFYGFTIAIIGHFLVLTAQFTITIMGFSLLGIGLSVIYPEIIRLASKTKTHNATTAISFVSGIGFLGFLSAPVLMGYISEISNLSTSFKTLTATCFIALLIIFKLKKRVL